MLRFLLRRIPRFGFLTLFATMLLFVSGAGWFKFHLDLYLEEERLLDDLAKAGCSVQIERYSDPARSAPVQRSWTPLPQLDRIRSLTVNYPHPKDRALIERAARLPCLHTIEARAWMNAPPPPPLGQPALRFTNLPIELPEVGEMPIPEADAPMPQGESLSQEDLRATAAAWTTAWSKPDPGPAAGVVRTVFDYAAWPGTYEGVEIHRPEMSVLASDEHFALANPGRISRFDADSPSGPLLESFRNVDPVTLKFRIDDVEMPYVRTATGRRVLQRFLDMLAGADDREAVLAEFVLDDFAAASHVEGGLVRFDFAPVRFGQPRIGLEGEYSLTVLLRPDRNFAVEAFDIDVKRTDAKIAAGDTTEVSFHWRGVSVDHGDLYVIEAASFDEPGYSGPGPALPLNTRYTFRSAYDFDQQPPVDLFGPAIYGVIELPPRRPLPVWRWYRVTFAISVALLAFVVIRRFAARNRIDDSGPVAEKARDGVEAN